MTNVLSLGLPYQEFLDYLKRYYQESGNLGFQKHKFLHGNTTVVTMILTFFSNTLTTCKDMRGRE